MIGNLSFLFIIIGGVILFFLWKKSATSSKPGISTELKIENVDIGGLIKLENIGPDMMDLDISIIGKHMYKEDGYTWFELEGESGELGKVWIDIENDDELEVNISLKELKLRDIGLTKQDLVNIDDEEEGEFKYNNEKYYYDDSGSVRYYKNCDQANVEKLYYWDFLTNDENHSITVEKWSDDSYVVWLSEYVKESQITVYSIKKEGE